MTDNASTSGPIVSVPVARLGIVELQEVQRWLGLSHPTTTKIMRAAGVPFFRLGQRKCCRWVDLEPWLSSMATEGYLDACTDDEKSSTRLKQSGEMATAA